MKTLKPEEKEKLQAMLDQHSTNYTETSNSISGVSTGRRFANFIIDIIIFRGTITLVLIPFVNTSLVQYLANNRLADWLFGIFMFFLHYFISEAAFQRSPAKLITSTKVVTPDGLKPGAGMIAKRTLIRFVPFEPFSGLMNTW